MGAEARFSRRVYLGLRGHELPEEFGILVVNDATIGGAKKALLFFLLLLVSVHKI